MSPALICAVASNLITAGYDGMMVSEHHADFPGYLPNPLHTEEAQAGGIDAALGDERAQQVVGRVEVGDEVEAGGCRFRVTSVRGRRIHRLTVLRTGT